MVAWFLLTDEESVSGSVIFQTDDPAARPALAGVPAFLVAMPDRRANENRANGC